MGKWLRKERKPHWSDFECLLLYLYNVVGKGTNGVERVCLHVTDTTQGSEPPRVKLTLWEKFSALEVRQGASFCQLPSFCLFCDLVEWDWIWKGYFRWITIILFLVMRTMFLHLYSPSYFSFIFIFLSIFFSPFRSFLGFSTSSSPPRKSEKCAVSWWQSDSPIHVTKVSCSLFRRALRLSKSSTLFPSALFPSLGELCSSAHASCCNWKTEKGRVPGTDH